MLPHSSGTSGKIQSEFLQLNFMLIKLKFISINVGFPKSVMLTHFNMSSNVMQFLQPGGTNHQIATTNYQDTYICLLPFFHTYGVTLLMNTGFETGAKLVTLPQFEVQSYLKAIDDHKVNISRYLTALFLSTLTHSVLCIII